MFTETINPKTKSVLEKIGASGAAAGFYLAGGTALALHLGHRVSVDLDFFSDRPLETDVLKQKLSSAGKFSLDYEDKDTLNSVLDGVKLSFFYYSHILLYPTVIFGGIQIADKRDIAAMKLAAISSRGSKKDFIDIYFLLKEYNLADLLEIFAQKYKGIDYNKLHILKSLTYFNDAENEPEPVMLKESKWSDIKAALVREGKSALV